MEAITPNPQLIEVLEAYGYAKDSVFTGCWSRWISEEEYHMATFTAPDVLELVRENDDCEFIYLVPVNKPSPKALAYVLEACVGAHPVKEISL